MEVEHHLTTQQSEVVVEQHLAVLLGFLSLAGLVALDALLLSTYSVTLVVEVVAAEHRVRPVEQEAAVAGPPGQIEMHPLLWVDRLILEAAVVAVVAQAALHQTDRLVALASWYCDLQPV